MAAALNKAGRTKSGPDGAGANEAAAHVAGPNVAGSGKSAARDEEAGEAERRALRLEEIEAARRILEAEEHGAPDRADRPEPATARRAERPADAADNVLHLRQGQRAGDPLVDYIALWMALEVFHDNCRLTEEGWSFLCDHLQRPLELRLLERRPSTLAGALKALTMASYIMENLEDTNDQQGGAWYRRLRLHLVNAARDTLRQQVESPGDL